jgi:hypothetical protein
MMTKCPATHQTLRVSGKARNGPAGAHREQEEQEPYWGKGKACKAKNGLPTCDRVVENPERKWRLALAPKETIMVAQNAPPLQMVIQNVGPAVFEVTIEDREPVILMTGKLSVMLAYGRITIENSEDMPGIAEMEFLPRSKS